MAGVIREATKFRNQQIGVVKASRGAVDVQDSVTKLADNITAMAVKEAGITAEREGKTFAKSLSENQLRSINPKTGKPEAFDAMPTTYGRIARDAFQDTVNTQYEQSIASEIQAMAKRTEALYPNDPDKYATTFGTNINVMKQHATGIYANLIDRYGSTYLASTKLSIQSAQIKKAQTHLKENVLISSEQTSQAITNMYGANASDQDIINTYNLQKQIIDKGKTGNVLGPNDSAKAFSYLNNSMVKGSITRYVLTGAGVEDDTKRKLITSISNKQKLLDYILAPQDTKLLQFDDTIIVAPKRTVMGTDGKTVVLPEMTMREYAEYTNERMEKLTDRDDVVSYLKNTITTADVIRNEENNEAEIKNKIKENSIIDSANSDIKKSTDTLVTNNETYVPTLKKIVQGLNKLGNQTTPSADGVKAKVSKDNYAKSVDKAYKATTYSLLRSILQPIKDNKELKEKTISALKRISATGDVDQLLYLTDVSEEDRKVITEDQFNSIKTAYREFRSVSNAKDFHQIFEPTLSNTSSAIITANNTDSKIEGNELKVLKAEKTNLLFKIIDDSKKVMSEASNIDVINNSEEVNRLLDKRIAKFTTMLKEHETLKDKSPYDRSQIIKARDAEVAAIIRGSFGHLLSQVDTEYTFEDSQGKEIKRKLTKQDVDNLANAFVVGKSDLTILPKEFKPLINGITKNQVMLTSDAASTMMTELKDSFESATKSASKDAAIQRGYEDINVKNDVKSEQIDDIINDLIWKDIEPDKTKRDPMWFTKTPFIDNETGKVHPLWSNVINTAMAHNRLPEPIVSHLNGLGDGTLGIITSGMSDANKAIITNRYENAFNVYKALTAFEVNNGGQIETINLLDGNKLLGHKVDKKSMARVEYALSVARVSGGDGQATELIKQLTMFNDEKERSGFRTVFLDNINNAYQEDKTLPKPSSIQAAVALTTNNQRLIMELTPWATEQVSIGKISNLDQMDEAIKEKLKEYQIPSRIVFTTVSDGGSWDGKNGTMVSPFALSKRLSSAKIEKFITQWQTQLPEGFTFARAVTEDYIRKQTIKDQQPNFMSVGGMGGSNKDVFGAFQSKDVYGDQPTYLMPMPNSSMDGKITYRAITVADNNGVLEMKYVMDQSSDNGYIEFTVDQDMINAGDPLSSDQQLEEINADIKLKNGQIQKLSQDPEFLNVNSDAGKAIRNKIVSLKTKVLEQEKNKKILETPSETAPSKDNSAEIGTNTDLILNSMSLLEVQEGFNPKQYKDGKNFSVAFGMYIPALTVDERKLIKNINNVTKEEGRAVLKVKVTKIIKGWNNITGNKFSNLPIKARTAMVSMAYQLDLTNIQSSKARKSWPKFLAAVKKASTFDYNSPEQKEALKEASGHMLYNYEDDGVTVKNRTLWYQQTPNRAEEMSKALLG